MRVRCAIAVGRRAAGFCSRGEVYLHAGREEGGCIILGRGLRDSVHRTESASWLGGAVFEGTGSWSGGGRRTKPSGCTSMVSVSWLESSANDCGASFSSGGEFARSVGGGEHCCSLG